MSKIKDYKIVSNNSVEKLVEEVNRLMSEGWQPSGGPSPIQVAGGFKLVQAMVLPPDDAWQSAG